MTVEEFRKLPFNDQRAMRREMFSPTCPAELMPLRDALVEENLRTGWFPEKWTEQIEEDE